MNVNFGPCQVVPLAKRGEPWFDDGNLILVTEDLNHAFRVHRGVLARHSEVFKGMFELPQSELTIAEMMDGCPMIRMYDIAIELSNLLKALYDGTNFSNASLDDFFYLAGILRLATKYFITHLRVQAIRFLIKIWPDTLAGHDAMVETALNSPVVANISFPYVHPLHIVNLAREVNLRLVVPSAIYFLSLYPLEDLLRADHPKLKVDHPSRPVIELTSSDVKQYTLMFQKRIDVILHFVRQFCGERQPAVGCTSGQISCKRGFTRLASRLSRSWMMRTGPLHHLLQATYELANDESVCKSCQNAFRNDVAELRHQLWNESPFVIGLPSWDELRALDLPS